jgi:hypothetical protein
MLHQVKLMLIALHLHCNLGTAPAHRAADFLIPERLTPVSIVAEVG